MTPEEFEHIANKLRPKLKSIGRDFFSDRDMADDVAQEVLMRLWIMRERIDVRLGVEALASRMAKNICVSEWRKRKTRITAGIYAPPPDICRQPTAMEDSDNRRMLEKAIGCLTPTEARLYRMRHMADMELAEMETVTGIKSRSISAMLSAARRKLLEAIRQQGGL